MANKDLKGKCRSGKFKYKSFTEAMIGGSKRLTGRGGKYYPNAYHCKHCKRYHITKGSRVDNS